jgi:hypothetical protein
MYTKEELDKLLADGNRKALTRRLQAYGLPMSEIVRMTPEDRVQEILRRQKEQWYREPHEQRSEPKRTEMQHPWWRNTTEAPMATHYDLAGLGIRELLQQALKGDGCVHSKVYNGYRKRGGVGEFLDRLAERLETSLAMFTSSPGNAMYILVNDHSVLHVNLSIFHASSNNAFKPYGAVTATPICDGVTINIDTLCEEDIDSLGEFCDAELETRHEPGVVEVLVQEAHGVSVRTLGKVTRPLERGNYTGRTIQQIDTLIRNLTAQAPVGRLTVINGDPGTGKTHLLQGLLHELEGINSWFVPPQLLIDLAGPQLLGVLLGRDTSKPLLMLIEDGDNCLVQRGADNMSSIQALLNIADGFIGQMLNIHVIVTTNAKNLEIDQALLRPGRLHQQISIGPLEAQHADAVLKRLTERGGAHYSNSTTLAQVYKDAAEMSRD